MALPFSAVLGLAVAVLATPQRAVPNHERAQLLALASASGVLVNYALGMLVPSLRLVLIADIVVAVTVFVSAWSLRRTESRLVLSMGGHRWLIFAVTLIVFAGAILFEPLNEWDARSIWFFGAKRIYFGEGFGVARDWTLPAYNFSHADYPKLLPLLGAQFGQAWGMWNEFIPKAALLVLLAPATAALLGLPRRMGWSAVFLVSVTLLSTREFMWNGYVDAYLAIYAVISMLYFARWIATSSSLNLALGGTFLGVAVNLKNEGSLLATCIVASLLAWAALTRGTRPIVQWRKLPPGVWVAFILPAVGFIGWALIKRHLQLENDLQLGFGSLQRFWQRLLDGQIAPVAKGLFVRTDVGKAAVLLIVVAVMARFLRCRISASAWFPAVVALFYLAGMFVIYMATPFGLDWHIETSAYRTMLVAAFGFFASTFLILEAIEARDIGPGSSRKSGLQT